MNSKLKFIMNSPFSTKLFEEVVVISKNQNTFHEKPDASFFVQRTAIRIPGRHFSSAERAQHLSSRSGIEYFDCELNVFVVKKVI